LYPALCLSRPWLVRIRLDLSFLQSIATAMAFSPARRPVASGRRHHPGYWCNMRANEDTNPGEQLTLYGYWRSSAAYRVRIALNLKGLSYQRAVVDLVRQGGEQHSEVFREINPQGLVPVLVHKGKVITQSMAICEYLDECFEQYPLLPAPPLQRARIRSMALQVACDIHPLNNLRVMKYLQAEYGDAVDSTAWMSHWMTEGFSAIEQQLSDHCQDFLASQPGLFECFLVPQVYNAQRFGTDLSAFPEIRHLTTKSNKLTAFIEAAPENQPDAKRL